MTAEPGRIRVRYVRVDAEEEAPLREAVAELQAKSILRHARSRKGRESSRN